MKSAELQSCVISSKVNSTRSFGPIGGNMFAKTRTIVVVVLAALLIALLFGATHTQAQSGDPTFGTPTISVDRTIYSFERIDSLQVFPPVVHHLWSLVDVI